VSVIGDGLFPVALAFAVLDELGGSPGQLGLVLAAETLPLAILILAAGVWADRLNRRNVMVVSDLGRAAVQATLATLLLSDAAHLWHVVALAALYGVFDAFFQPAAGGLVPEIAGREHLQEANALLGLARHVGLVVGPALAGVLIAVSSPGTAIAVDAATFVISAAFLTQLRVTFVRRASEHHFSADLKGGIAEVARRRWMWTFMPGFSAYHLLALPCVLALGPVIADRELNGASSWATITACFGIGTILGSVAALRIRARHPMYGATLAFIAASCQALIIAYGASTAAIAALQVVAGRRRRLRVHAVGHQPRPRDPAARALARHLAGLVHHHGTDADRVRRRGAGGGALRHAHDDARGRRDRDRAVHRRAGGGRRPPPHGSLTA
jgi:MFS family permease